MKTEDLIEYLKAFPDLEVYVQGPKGDEKLDEVGIVEIKRKSGNYLFIGK